MEESCPSAINPMFLWQCPQLACTQNRENLTMHQPLENEAQGVIKLSNGVPSVKGLLEDWE